MIAVVFASRLYLKTVAPLYIVQSQTEMEKKANTICTVQNITSKCHLCSDNHSLVIITYNNCLFDYLLCSEHSSLYYTASLSIITRMLFRVHIQEGIVQISHDPLHCCRGIWLEIFYIKFK